MPYRRREGSTFTAPMVIIMKVTFTFRSVHSMTSSMAPTDVKKSCPSPIASLKLSRDEIIWDDTEELMAETVT